MSAARNSGSKLVFGAVTLTLAAVGVGTIYLPFIADKDRIRGLHEEGEMTASEKREYEKMLQQMKQAERSQQAPQRPSNNMWDRMKPKG